MQVKQFKKVGTVVFDESTKSEFLVIVKEGEFSISKCKFDNIYLNTNSG